MKSRSLILILILILIPAFAAEIHKDNTFTGTSHLTSGNSLIVDSGATLDIGSATLTLPASIVVTSGSYSDPAWITSLAKSKAGLGNVSNTSYSHTLTLGNGSVTIGSAGQISAVTDPTNLQTTNGVLALASFSSITGTIAVGNLTNTITPATLNFGNGSISFAAQGVVTGYTAATNLLTLTGNGSGLTGLTSTQVGLGNVSNTSYSHTLTLGNGSVTIGGAGQISAVTDPTNLQTTGGTLALAGFASVTGTLPVANLPPNSKRDVFVFGGDSRFASAQGSGGTTAPEKIMGWNWKNNPRWINTSANGRTLSTVVANYATEVAPYKPATIGSTNSYWIVQAGCNDAYTSVSAATIEASFQSLYAAAHADGIKVVVSTIFAYGDSTADATIATVNTWLKGAGSAYYDYLVDTTDLFTDATNQLYYINATPAAHLNDYGSFLFAERAAQNLAALLDTADEPLTTGGVPLLGRINLRPTNSTVTIGVIEQDGTVIYGAPGGATTGNMCLGIAAGNPVNVTGTGNTSMGYQALNAVTTGNRNSAFGYQALTGVTTAGNNNTGAGVLAGYQITTGSANSCFGYKAGSALTTGSFNMGIGSSTLANGYSGSAPTGDKNTGVGWGAGQGLSGAATENTFVGDEAGYGAAAMTGSGNTLIGMKAGNNITTASEDIIIGHNITPSSATTTGLGSIGNLILMDGLGTQTGTTVVTSGHVGIGVASGTYMLNVGGTINATGVATFANIKRGAGSPEGAVTGIVGDLYTRTDGGASTTLYVKESGTGNTGWIAK